LEDAFAVQQAGAFSIVLEAVPSEIAKIVTQELTIPTIGIGAGPYCSGQVLVQLDMLAGYSAFTPKYDSLLFANEDLLKYMNRLGRDQQMLYEGMSKKSRVENFQWRENIHTPSAPQNWKSSKNS
jgi:hypothetical protein